MVCVHGPPCSRTHSPSPRNKHRINKFYLLMRRFVNSSLRLLASEGWDEAATKRWGQIWMKEGGALW